MPTVLVPCLYSMLCARRPAPHSSLIIPCLNLLCAFTPCSICLAFTAWQTPKFDFCLLLHESFLLSHLPVTSAMCPYVHPLPCFVASYNGRSSQHSLNPEMEMGVGLEIGCILELNPGFGVSLDFNPVLSHLLCDLRQIALPL